MNKRKRIEKLECDKNHFEKGVAVKIKDTYKYNGKEYSSFKDIQKEFPNNNIKVIKVEFVKKASTL